MLLDACLVAEEVLAPPTGKSQETPEVYTDEDVKSCGTLGPKVRSGLCAFFGFPTDFRRLTARRRAPCVSVCVRTASVCACLLCSLQTNSRLVARRAMMSSWTLDAYAARFSPTDCAPRGPCVCVPSPRALLRVRPISTTSASDLTVPVPRSRIRLW